MIKFNFYSCSSYIHAYSMATLYELLGCSSTGVFLKKHVVHYEDNVLLLQHFTFAGSQHNSMLIPPSYTIKCSHMQNTSKVPKAIRSITQLVFCKAWLPVPPH